MSGLPRLLSAEHWDDRLDDIEFNQGIIMSQLDDLASSLSDSLDAMSKDFDALHAELAAAGVSAETLAKFQALDGKFKALAAANAPAAPTAPAP